MKGPTVSFNDDQDSKEYVSDLEVLLTGLTLVSEQASDPVKDRASKLIAQIEERQRRASDRPINRPANLHAFSLATQLEFQLGEQARIIRGLRAELQIRGTALQTWKDAFKTLATSSQGPLIPRKH